jgi:hypothetical protein
VVGRGLAVNAAIACQNLPLAPDVTNVPEIIETQVGLSEREKADYRASLQECGPCHTLFDSYGLALDVFDSIGRHRTMDPEGRLIDPRVSLPAIFDRAIVSGPEEMARVMATSDAFEACMAMSYAGFALADVSQGSAQAPYPAQPATSCTVREILRAFDEAGDASLSGLLVQIARARLLRLRVNTP